MNGSGGTTIVTQTTPLPDRMAEFAEWQRRMSEAIAGVPGFLRQAVIPPHPPTQVDWVILQHFADRDTAVAWLHSPLRSERLAEAQPLILGRDDVHLVAGEAVEAPPTPVSLVVSTQVKSGQEAAFRAWERRMAAAQARAPGFQGYRLEPPIPGLQEDWLAIVTFATEADLKAWLASPERARLLTEAEGFTQEFHTRIARTGFQHWFDSGRTAVGAVPAWKQNMIVLLLLYPVVFLFGSFVQAPWLMGRLGLPFPVALFLGNVASVLLLNSLVPWTSKRFDWWLSPVRVRPTFLGVALLLALYGLMIFVFTHLP
ncbi:antibiotic biosynthesis monooxygenase [Dankookia rubra]|uniref:Antibiotic biosynthesis monooxygenase n=1 Tax=Dankookia rubra TaxID=1442381 RepID=A0A4V3A995_9PROT|nr:antibiotic biosynthesis monooxygenase [Dankookia rubra]TDH58405.1 antibiotic biosynthesis monooxygenase [Dankookia rubra]